MKQGFDKKGDWWVLPDGCPTWPEALGLSLLQQIHQRSTKLEELIGGVGRQFGTELLPALLFRIRYFPYTDKLTPFEMFGEPLPPIPAKGRPQTIEMFNHFFLQSLQALQPTTQDVQSRLPPPPVPLLIEPVHRFQPKNLAWVAHPPIRVLEPSWEKQDLNKTHSYQCIKDSGLDPLI